MTLPSDTLLQLLMRPLPGSLAIAALLLGGCATSPDEKASRAIAQNDARGLASALKSGAQSDKALKSAVEGGREELVRLLLLQGANPNCGDESYDLGGPILATNAVTHQAWEMEVMQAWQKKAISATAPKTKETAVWETVAVIKDMRPVGQTNWSDVLNVEYLEGISKRQVFYQWRMKKVPGPRVLHLAVSVASEAIVSDLLKAGADSTAVVATVPGGVLNEIGFNRRAVNEILTAPAGLNIQGAGNWWLHATADGVANSSEAPIMARWESPAALAKRLTSQTTDQSRQQHLGLVLERIEAAAPAREAR